MLMKTEAFGHSFKPGSLLSIYHFENAPFLAWIGENKTKILVWSKNILLRFIETVVRSGLKERLCNMPKLKDSLLGRLQKNRPR